MSGILEAPSILRLPLAAAADGRLAMATQAEQVRKIITVLEAIVLVRLTPERGYGMVGGGLVSQLQL